MISPQEQRGWLEAIKELKAEWYIGSLPAFKYLKEALRFEAAQQAILKLNPGLREKHNFTLRENARVLSMVGAFLGLVLDKLSAEISTPENLSLSHHVVLIWPDQVPAIEPQYSLELRYWLIDPVPLLVAFLEILPSRADGIQIINNLYTWMDRAFRAGKIKLLLAETREPVSFSEFTQSMQYRGSSQDFFWGCTWAHLQSEEKNNGPLSDEENTALQRAVDTRNIAAAQPPPATTRTIRN